MFNIAVCDDTAKELFGIMSSLESYLKRRRSDIETSEDVFSKSQDLLDASAEKRYDLLLLDIIMADKDGIETAKEARKFNPDVKIIFISTTSEFALDAFSVNAVSYLLKPFTQTQFDETLDRVFSKITGKKTEGVTIKTLTGALVNVDINDVLYVESRERMLRLVMDNADDILTKASLTGLYDVMEKFACMVKCGGSYILNLNGIRKIDSKAVVMNNGAAIPVPRRVMPELKKQYIEFYES